MRKIGMVIALCLWMFQVQAELRLPRVFADHMVLQRGQEIPVWGSADSRERVTVSFQGKEYRVRADREGNWELKMDALSKGGPYTLTVTTRDESVTYENVMIGDVWLLGGQSNMEWALKNTNNGEDSIKTAKHPDIRLFEVGRNLSLEPIDDVPEAKWSVCSPETVENFSAIGYYFARRIQTDLDVPIGLLDINWGGTLSEAWTSPEALMSHEDFRERVVTNQTEGPKDFSDPEVRKPNLWPTSLYYGMLEPVIPFAIKGALWYQGESNAGRAYQYREIFPLLITDWRDKWGQGDFPFLWVQLANFRQPKDEPADSDWAELREAQSMTLSLPNTGQAVIIDKGEADDIHPRDKWTVGERLAKAAKKIAYGMDVVYSGPTFKSMEIQGDQIRISFDHIGSGLMVKDKYGYVKGFAVAGADKKFHWVKGFQDGNQIVLETGDIDDPVAVRYAWADNPDDVNLYNKEGLPANPFRTDEWQGITYGKK
ncbi:sialate O-acetylesterase [Cyclobacterium sp. GBPx2]|uniref:Sialate O-acetylesterase n=2 Tax=Cyclobacteriaceae TaxID=563798 RepID=A0ABX0HBL5_9BACT|nr:sialate O-acetylesterase [Cyclobacterium sp.]MBD3626513.1 sialate O-acetylesterase [Cyclobacterium sp.]NHE59158.1 sialate O-acetylesterase [Cyclobacterium plantarum]